MHRLFASQSLIRPEKTFKNVKKQTNLQINTKTLLYGKLKLFIDFISTRQAHVTQGNREKHSNC